MNIDGFFMDGANVQAQIVALLLREMREWILEPTYDREFVDKYWGRIQIGRLENCREQGYVFSLKYDFYDFSEQRNYGVYEHRNTDSICVLVNDLWTINTPTMEQIWEGKKGKYDYDKDFNYGEWEKCARWIAEDMRKHLEEWVEKRNEQKKLSEKK